MTTLHDLNLSEELKEAGIEDPDKQKILIDFFVNLTLIALESSNYRNKQ